MNHWRPTPKPKAPKPKSTIARLYNFKREVDEAFREYVKRGDRSQFINEAIREKIEREKQKGEQ